MFLVVRSDCLALIIAGRLLTLRSYVLQAGFNYAYFRRLNVKCVR
jgi:hypothetical protein